MSWEITDYGSTSVDYAEDSGYDLVWVGTTLTLPVTYANNGHPAILMQLDLGVGPSPDEILDVSAMFQLTNDLSYAVSLTEVFLLAANPHVYGGADTVELNEGAGSNVEKTLQHHGARTMARKWRCPNDSVDRSTYRYLSVVISASSTQANNGNPPNPYLKVDRDYGHLDYTRLTPVPA